MKIKIYGTILLMLFLVATCGQKMPLPKVEASPESFGASDTSYVHLTTTWDAATLGYSAANPMTPVDIAIGADGYIFVADRTNDRIMTISPAGELINYFNLDKIAPVSNPTAIDIDAKLNLLIVNGSNVIYVWNQYLNTIGVDSILTDYIHGKYIFSADQSKIDSVLGIHPFYVDDNELSSFQGITFGPSSDSTIFVSDSGNNRILSLKIKYSGAVRLSNGYMHPTFKGQFAANIANYGSGAGTVDNPRGITADAEGNLYFTQLGGNFLVQKLIKQATNYISAYTLYVHPIMDLNRFFGPVDVALDANEAIFVLDAEEGRVQKFFNKGVKAGAIADLGKTGLAVAIFNNPLGIAISDDHIVYIADTNNHRIERFKYSISDSDLPVEQP